MNSEIIYTDQNIYLNQAVNMFISAVKFHILTWGSMGIDSLLQPAPSGHSRNCSLWHFLIVFTAQHGSLPLGVDAGALEFLSGIWEFVIGSFKVICTSKLFFHSVFHSCTVL